MKKTLSIILSMIMLLSTVVGLNITAFAATDYADDPMEANAIRLDGTQYIGELTESNRQDYFKLNLNDDGELTIVYFSYLDVYFDVCDENMESLSHNNVVGSSQSPKGSSTSLVLSEGVYYIKVYPYSSRTGKYWLKATFNGYNTNETEPNNTRVQAQKLDAGKTVIAALTRQDEVDYFKFSLPAASNVTFNVSCEEGKDLYLYKANAESYTFGKWGTNFSHTESLSAGDYVIKVVRGSNGKYFIKWNFEVNAPTELRATQNTNKVYLSWNKASGANGYIIERYNSGKWNEIGTTTASSYTVSSLYPAEEYQFRVKSYLLVGGTKFYSNPIFLKTATKPAKVTLSSVKSPKSKKLTVKWKKTAGSGYVIQYSTSKKFKNAMSVTAGAKATSKTISGLKGKKKYYVRVRAYKTVNGEKVYGAWSNVKSAKTKK